MANGRARQRRYARREALRSLALDCADLALIWISAVSVVASLGGAVWLWSVAMSR